MKLWVRTTTAHVNRGNLRSVCGCPVAIAIQEAVGGYFGSVLVTPHDVIFCRYGEKDIHVELPQNVKEWIYAFDNCDLAGQPPLPDAPFFSIEVPDEVVSEKRKCPKCHRHMMDLRHTAFNTQTIDRDGICFQWAEDAFACNAAWAAKRGD